MSLFRNLLRGTGRSLVSSAASNVQFQKRHLGVLDSVTNMATNAISGTKEKQFEKMLEQMMATEPKNWTLRPWKKTMEDQLNGWIMYVPGVSSTSEVKEIKHFKLMLDVMTDAELDRPHEINGQARERIAKASGRGADEVARLVFFYRQSLILCTWLQAKKKAEPRVRPSPKKAGQSPKKRSQ